MPVENNLRLDELLSKLDNPSGLMDDWIEHRNNAFEQMMDSEQSPYQGNLRSLSFRYLEWKRRKYPGKKKRELTGETRRSHRVVKSGKKSIVETLKGKGALLQNYLELPILPMSGFDSQTEAAFIELAWKYFDP